jgi:hypothetical protein
MLSSVAAELATPILVARFGYRAVFGAGLILLGVPALLLPVSIGLAIVVAICVVRGLASGAPSWSAPLSRPGSRRPSDAVRASGCTAS